MKRRSAVLISCVLTANACSDSSQQTGAETTTTTAAVSLSTEPPNTVATTTTVFTGYSAQLTRTSYGVAHIVADDWGSLGFGQGYAFAQDRACTLIDQVIKVRGERSKWFGAGDNNTNIDSDFAYRHLGLHDTADTRFGDLPANITEMVQGYVDGFNRELEQEGPHGWCVGEPWVQPLTTTDLYAYLNDVMLFASAGVLLNQIATAQPPVPEPPWLNQWLHRSQNQRSR